MFEMTEKDELFQILSDVYKEAYGVRPRFYKIDDMSIEDLQNEIDSISKIAEEEYKRQCEIEAENLVEFRKLIASTINMGAKDVETAIRWICDDEHDIGYIEFYNGIAYGSINKILAEQ